MTSQIWAHWLSQKRIQVHVFVQGSCSHSGSGNFHKALTKAFLGHAGKLITVRGAVIRASPIRQLINSMEYACTRCGCRQRCTFPDGATTRPLTCSDGCRSRTFTPILGSARTVAWQRVRLQVGIISLSHVSPLKTRWEEDIPCQSSQDMMGGRHPKMYWNLDIICLSCRHVYYTKQCGDSPLQCTDLLRGTMPDT